jgi:hypothetical protein
MLFLLNELPYLPPALTENFVLLTILHLVQSPITSLSQMILTPGNAVNGLVPSTLHFSASFHVLRFSNKIIFVKKWNHYTTILKITLQHQYIKSSCQQTLQPTDAVLPVRTPASTYTITHLHSCISV